MAPLRLAAFFLRSLTSGLLRSYLLTKLPQRNGVAQFFLRYLNGTLFVSELGRQRLFVSVVAIFESPPVPIPNTVVKLSEPMIVPTSAKVRIAGFFNNHKARLQKCNRAFLLHQCRTVFQTVSALRPQLRNARLVKK